MMINKPLYEIFYNNNYSVLAHNGIEDLSLNDISWILNGECGLLILNIYFEQIWDIDIHIWGRNNLEK